MQVKDFGRGAASWQHYPGARPEPLHFAPANGLPAATYRFFIERFLPHYSVSTLDNRGAWPNCDKPERTFNWRHHLADFFAFADQHYREPIHYVGHSLGATLGLMAAIEKPSLFKSLVMIDPGTVPDLWSAVLMRLLPDFFIDRWSLIKSTAARRNVWPDHAAFADYISQRSTYRNFTERALHDYAHGGLEQCDQGLRLRFSPQWEAHNFKNTAYVWPHLKKLAVPTLLLRGEHSKIFSQARYKQLVARFNSCNTSALRIEQLDGIGHLAPQEAPDQTASAVLQGLRRLQAAR